MKFFIRTLGCKVNWLDSARIGAALQSAGHTPTSDEQEADFVFVNTCTVTGEADRKSRSLVNAAQRARKAVGVMGCGPKVDADQWQSSEDRLVFPDEEALLRHFDVDTENLPFATGSRTRLPIAVQMGCDNLCTFCITRVARGRHQNVPAETVVEQVKQAFDLGVTEIVLTGVNLAAWGCEDSRRAEEGALHLLLESLLQQTEMPRIRLSSLGPQFLHRPFFDLFAEPRICDHLHLSVQSGSPTVLSRMVRGHGDEEIRRIAEQARAVRPGVGLAADLIVGFPGETEHEFQETLALARETGLSKLHVFPYSIREGTPAAMLPDQIEGVEKKRRAAELRALGSELRKRFIQSQMGKPLEILVESTGSGLSGNYIRVRVPLGAMGEIKRVVLTEENIAER